MAIRGGKVVLIPSPRTETVFEAIEREKITIMPTPRALLIRWMEAPELPKYHLKSLDIVLAGGAKLNAYSDANRPPIPIQTGHLFRSNPASHSEANRPPSN